MHVLHLDLGREMRGGQRQVYYLARGQHQAGALTPVVACLKDTALHRALTDAGVETLPLCGHREWNPLVFLAPVLSHRRTRFSLLHSHDARAASLAALLQRSFLKDAALVHTRRTVLPMRGGWSRAKYLQAAAVACVSNGVAEALAKTGMPREKLAVIPSAIDPDRYTRKTERNDGRCVFGMVGALTPEKGHAVLLQALALVRTRFPGLRWEARFAGGGPLLSELLELGRALGILDCLSFLGWQESSRILPQCDILIVPSTEREASSGAIREGWVVGLPVVCSNLPGNLELVRHEVNGLSFVNGSAQDLALQLGRLVQSPDLGRRLTEQGRESLGPYLVEAMVKSYAALYGRVLGPEA